MQDNKVMAAVMVRLPKRISWSVGDDEQSYEGQDWQGLFDRLAHSQNRPSTLSITFLLDLNDQKAAANNDNNQQEAEQ